MCSVIDRFIDACYGIFRGYFAHVNNEDLIPCGQTGMFWFGFRFDVPVQAGCDMCLYVLTQGKLAYWLLIIDVFWVSLPYEARASAPPPPQYVSGHTALGEDRKKSQHYFRMISKYILKVILAMKPLQNLQIDK